MGRALPVGILLAALLLQAIVLFLLGQPAICECGSVKLWEGVVLSSGNSQHFSDWYSLSHIIHGILFFFALSYFFPRMPVLWRFSIAIGIEMGWEILENTPMVIEHYRQQALAQGYVGDSIVNSLSDTAMMAIGFILARFSPLWLSVSAVLVLEGIALYAIRDSLLLNIIGFFGTPGFIESWQIAS